MAGTRATVTAPGPRVERAVGTTDGAGNVTFTWVPPFTVPPVVAATVEAGAGFHCARVTVNTAAATEVNVQQSAGITILGIGVLAAGTAAAGVEVHCLAVEP